MRNFSLQAPEKKLFDPDFFLEQNWHAVKHVFDPFFFFIFIFPFFFIRLRYLLVKEKKEKNEGKIMVVGERIKKEGFLRLIDLM